MKYDFEQAKQKVAERNGYESWGEYEYANFMKTGDTHSIWEEVFQMGCNEAVKEDRGELNTILEKDGVYYRNTVKNRPLPFPET